MKTPKILITATTLFYAITCYFPPFAPHINFAKKFIQLVLLMILCAGFGGIKGGFAQCPPTYTDTIAKILHDNRNCTDYPIEKIGNQWWMTENLNYGTYVPATSPQVSGTKFCQNLSGVNDATCPMGGLYEWANLMQGSATCNGTGAPPDDKCATPAQ